MRALALVILGSMSGLAGGCHDDACHDECVELDAAATPDAPPGTPDAAPAPDANVVAHDYSMPANSFKEAELEFAPGASLTMTFSSSASALEWNIHTHDSGQTQYLAEGTAAQHTEQLTFAAGGPVWLMWRNPAGAAATELHVELELGDGVTLVTF